MAGQFGYRNRKRRLGGPAEGDPFEQPAPRATKGKKTMKQFKGGLDDLTGDPYVDEQALEDGGHSHVTKQQGDFAEGLIRSRIDQADEQARQMGIRSYDDFRRPEDDEYFGEAPLGLADSVKQTAYEQEARRPYHFGEAGDKPIREASRQDWQAAEAEVNEMIEDSTDQWDDFSAEYPELASDPAAVQAAAARVVAGWRREGFTGNVRRRMKRRPVEFLDAVAVEAVSTPPSASPRGDSSGRAVVFGGSGSGGRSMAAREADEPEDFMAALMADQKRSGYF